MIVDLILTLLYGVLNILLSPLAVLNVGIDFLASFPVITQFLQIIAYVLPWPNLLPLISFTVAMFVFRIAISIVSKIKSIIPFF